MIGYFSKWLRRNKASAATPVFRPDFYSVGYPKTGNTWIRMMLGRYVQQVRGLGEMPLFDIAEMQELFASGYAGATGVFTHEPLTWESQTADDLDYDLVIAPFVGRRVLFLTRYPLDTLVSSFMQAKFKVSPAYPGDLSAFLTDPVYGLDKLIRFHDLWARHKGDTAGFLLTRYEDTHADPTAQLRRLIDFLGEPVDDAAITDAVHFASFDNLKAIETSGQKLVYKSSGFNAFGDGPRNNPNAFFVRKGGIGGYRDEIDADVARELETRIAERMPAMFGYGGGVP